MNKLKLLIVAALMLPALGQAALNLPEPEVLIQQAGESRSALLDSILAIEFNIPEMRDPATFEKYFYTLDNLQALAICSGLEEYYPDAVKKLGVNLVSNGMRWLDVTKADTNKITYYIKWMDVDSLARFLGLIEYQTSTVKDAASLKKMSENIEAALPLIDKIASNLPYVQLGFRGLVSGAAVAILKTENLDNNGLSFWIGKIKTASALSEYLDVLNTKIYSMEKDTQGLGHSYLFRLALLSAQVNNMAEKAPNWLVNGIGDSTAEVILRLVRLEEKFQAGEFKRSLSLLSGRQLQGMYQQWMIQTKIPNQNYVGHYLELSRELIVVLQNNNMRKEANEFQKWLTKMTAPALAKQLDIEGQYEIRNERGDVWYFTIATAKDNTLIAALANKDKSILKAYYNVSYNLKKDGFVASQREPDGDSIQNQPVEFVVRDGQITVYDPFVRNQYKTYKGRKIQAFPDPYATAVPGNLSADGTYEGYISMPNGEDMKVRVIITTFNGYTVGRVDSPRLVLELNIGSEGEDGVVILTSGRKEKAAWFQLRANVVEGGLNAYVIVGGSGQGKAWTFLKRLN